jgi:hypothetical protein
MQRRLSDLNGIDPYPHGGKPIGLLRSITNALVRPTRQPTVRELAKIYQDLKAAANLFKADQKTDNLFESRVFKDLVSAAGRFAKARISTLNSPPVDTTKNSSIAD